MKDTVILDKVIDVCVFHFRAHGTVGTLCCTENIRLLTGHSNHEQNTNLDPCDVGCWHYKNKSFKCPTIIHAMGETTSRGWWL